MRAHHKCPKCGSQELTTKTEHRDDISLIESVSCNACGYSWKEYYALTLLDVKED